MTVWILHHAQTALLTSIAALSLALIVVDALVLKYIAHRQDGDYHFWLLKRSSDGVVTRYLAFWRYPKDRAYYALMAIGAIGLFVSCVALAVQYGLKRMNIRLPNIQGKSRPIQSAPFTLFLVVLPIPVIIVTMVLLSIDSIGSWKRSICEYVLADGTNHYGPNYCFSWAPLTVEQWTCHLAHDTREWDGATLDGKVNASQLCTKSRFVHWVTVPLLVLTVLSASVAVVQLFKTDSDTPLPARDPTLARLSESQENLVAPSSSNEAESNGSQSDRVLAAERTSAENMSSPAGVASDN